MIEPQGVNLPRKIHLFVILSVSGLAACGALERSEINPGEFDIAGYERYANDDALNGESLRACPQGYEFLGATHGMVAEGAAWHWHIRCWIRPEQN